MKIWKFVILFFMFSILSINTLHNTEAQTIPNLTLDPIPEIVKEGEMVVFSGKLETSDGERITDAPIQIKEDIDLGIDKILGIIKTNENGEFFGTWKASLSITGEPYDFYVDFAGNNEIGYTRSETFSVTITPLDQTIFSNPILSLDALSESINMGDDVTFSGTFTSNGNPIPGKIIYIKDDYSESSDNLIVTTQTDTNGKFLVTWKATPKQDNNYSFYAEYLGDALIEKTKTINQEIEILGEAILDDFKGFLQTEKKEFVFSKYETSQQVRISGNTTEYSKGEFLTIEIRHPNQSVESHKVSVTEAKNFFLPYPIDKNTRPGHYTISAKYLSNEFEPITFYVEIIDPHAVIEQKESFIEVNQFPESINIGNEVAISGKLVTKDGAPISGKNVWIEAESSNNRVKAIAAITFQGGHFFAKIPFTNDNDAAKWNFFIGFDGDEGYSKTSKSFELEALSIPKKIKYSQPVLQLFPLPSLVNAGNIVTFSGTFTAYGVPVPNKVIYIKEDHTIFPDTLLETVRTDSNGEFLTFWEVARKKSGDYDIYVEFTGDEQAKNVRTANQRMIISQENLPTYDDDDRFMEINRNEFIFYPDSTSKYSIAIISGEVSQYFKGRPILLELKRPDDTIDNFKIMVSADGSFTMELHLGKYSENGIYTINAKYGDQSFKPISLHIFVLDKFTTKPKESVLYLEPVSENMQVGIDLLLSGSLTTIDGDPIDDRFVWITAKSSDTQEKSLGVATNNFGDFNAKMPFQVGSDVSTWNLHASFLGEDKLQKSKSEFYDFHVYGTEVNYTKSEILISEKPEIIIPYWVKNNAKWWVSGLISDSEFVDGMRYLISQNVIIVDRPQVEPSEEIIIPVWVKNTARMWANDSISDQDFIYGIKYLIEKGVIVV